MHRIAIVWLASLHTERKQHLEFPDKAVEERVFKEKQSSFTFLPVLTSYLLLGNITNVLSF